MDNNDLQYDHIRALDDFNSARRNARLEMISSWLSGKPAHLLQYDEVRKRVQLVESAAKHLEEIPLDAIVGTVGRYSDFSRQLLPLKQSDHTRWANVRRAVESMQGLPPIDVYQVGAVYFIMDGHHRASVARELGASHIQAFVRKVSSPIPLSPEDDIEDVILKAEYAAFLKSSQLDVHRPNANLQLSVAGAYDQLLEHISVHRYFMGIDESRAIGYEEAVKHWYDTIYLPVVEVIRGFNLLADFPNRSEADLYLWVMEHRTELESKLGWKVATTTAASDLITKFSPGVYQFIARTAARIFDAILPDQLELSPPTGLWRQQREKSKDTQSLFDNILVAIPGDDEKWNAVDYSLIIAGKEQSFLGGLHIVNATNKNISIDDLQKEFCRRCDSAQVASELAIEEGNITRLLYERSYWGDLMVLRLAHPPPFLSFRRLGSGLRTLIRRRKTPILLVPPSSKQEMNRVLLAYGGGPNADEALYVAAYMALKWNVDLSVLVVEKPGGGGDELINKAKAYLIDRGIPSAQYQKSNGAPAQAILTHAGHLSTDLIVMGGYEGGYIRELIFGSTVDRVLWKTVCPVLICH